MRLFKSKKTDKYISAFLQVISIAAVILGTWLCLSGLYHFSKGYFAVQKITRNEIPDKNSTSGVNTGTGNSKKKSRMESKAAIAGKKQNLYPVRPAAGNHLGQLYIPKLDAVIPIYEGTEEDELEKGVGHFAESVLPGETDNCVLSGHRDTVFRKLGEVGTGDLLIVRTSAGEFQYKVSKVRIVDANDRTVIVPKPRATLTVSTCYPFHYVGPAPKRYILVAYLADKKVN